MFDKHFSFINDDTNAIIAANITAMSTKELGKKLEDISKAEIKSKDRVDITLEEYLTMRKRIEELEAKNSRMSKLVIQLGIPAEVINSIKTDSIRVVHNDDICDFVRHYRIAFDVDASPDIMKWRY